MKKIFKLFTFLLVPTIYMLTPSLAYAVCPVCTAMVIGGLGLSRFIGIDDSVSGVWVGGLILSLSFWLTDWVVKKGYLKKLKRYYILAISAISLYIITFVPMQLTNFIGHPANRIWGIDKLVFGSIVGIIAFFVGLWADKKERQIKGKHLFEFQKVIFLISALTFASGILYFVTR